SLPAVARLRRVLPLAQIDWVVEERWSELLCSRPELRAAPRAAAKPLVDTVRVVDTRAWRQHLLASTTRHAVRELRSALRTANYDVAVDLQSAVKSAVVAQLAGARTRLGFARPIEAPAGLFYTRREAARGQHIAEQNISLADAVFALAHAAAPAPQAFAFPLPCDAQHEAWADTLRRRVGTFALINPGAGWGAKCWPAE